MSAREGRASGFEFVEHTADLGIRAWGPHLDDAFAHAARGLIEYMVDVDAAKSARAFEVTAEAANPERLLFAFLDEILFIHQTEIVVFTTFDVTIEAPASEGAPWRLRATAHGEAFDAARHGHVHEIKAITYHGIRVIEGPPAEVFVVVDI